MTTSASFVILAIRRRRRMILLSSSSSRSRVSTEKSHSLRGHVTKLIPMNRMETSPPSRRSSSIHQRPHPLFLRIREQFPNIQPPGLLGQLVDHLVIVVGDDRDDVDLCGEYDLVDCGGDLLCTFVVLYSGELEGVYGKNARLAGWFID